VREVIILGCELFRPFPFPPLSLLDEPSLLTFVENAVTTLFNIVPKGFTRDAMEWKGIIRTILHWGLQQFMVGRCI
jgi:hypothetical protein